MKKGASKHKASAFKVRLSKTLHRVVFVTAAIFLLFGFVWSVGLYWHDNVQTSQWTMADAWPSVPQVKVDGDGWLTGAVALFLQQYSVDFMLHYEVDGKGYARTANLHRFLPWRAESTASGPLVVGQTLRIKYDPKNPREMVIVQPKNEPWYGFWVVCASVMAISAAYIKKDMAKKPV